MREFSRASFFCVHRRWPAWHKSFLLQIQTPQAVPDLVRDFYVNNAANKRPAPADEILPAHPAVWIERGVYGPRTDGRPPARRPLDPVLDEAPSDWYPTYCSVAGAGGDGSADDRSAFIPAEAAIGNTLRSQVLEAAKQGVVLWNLEDTAAHLNFDKLVEGPQQRSRSCHAEIVCWVGCRQLKRKAQDWWATGWEYDARCALRLCAAERPGVLAASYRPSGT